MARIHNVVHELDPAIQTYYDKGNEASRLMKGAGRLELERTKELIERFVERQGLEVLDVGGGPGAYATWLSELGDRVHLIDPVPAH